MLVAALFLMFTAVLAKPITTTQSNGNTISVQKSPLDGVSPHFISSPAPRGLQAFSPQAHARGLPSYEPLAFCTLIVGESAFIKFEVLGLWWHDTPGYESDNPESIKAQLWKILKNKENAGTDICAMRNRPNSFEKIPPLGPGKLWAWKGIGMFADQQTGLAHAQMLRECFEKKLLGLMGSTGKLVDMNHAHSPCLIVDKNRHPIS